MRQLVTSTGDLEAKETYEIYHDGHQVDKLHTVIVNPESDTARVTNGQCDSVSGIPCEGGLSSVWMSAERYKQICTHEDMKRSLANLTLTTEPRLQLPRTSRTK